MRNSAEQGMTILEVIIAITIFLIGIGFVLQSDAVSHKYFNQGQVRQQMLFYASGILECAIEGLDQGQLSDFSNFNKRIERMDYTHPDFHQYVAEGDHLNEYLEVIKVTVTSPSGSEPVELYTYRVKYDEEE